MGVSAREVRVWLQYVVAGHEMSDAGSQSKYTVCSGCCKILSGDHSDGELKHTRNLSNEGVEIFRIKSKKLWGLWSLIGQFYFVRRPACQISIWGTKEYVPSLDVKE